MDNTRYTNPEYVEEIIALLNEEISVEELQEIICNYHESDIADAFEQLTEEQRKKIYSCLGDEQLSEIFAYLEDVEDYVAELDIKRAADILSEMDSDDAVDVLEEIDDAIEEKIVDLMDDDDAEDIKLIQSYEDDEVGSKMTTNYVEINKNMAIKEAMRSLIKQAEENDNISTIYVSDDEGKFYGAIDLKDLIIARENTPLENIITNSYPTVYAHEGIADLLADLQDYSEDSFPVLDEDDHIIGIITAQDITEVVDEEFGEDYAKLAGLSGEEDMTESVFTSVKKRLPWLVVLLALSMGVSSIVGVFEQVVDVIPLLVAFQSLILDMAGNVGTQSLAVTIRLLTGEELTFKDKAALIFKEIRVGLFNGAVLGLFALVFVTIYLMIAKEQTFQQGAAIALCVALALVLAMIISSFVGTFVPIFLNQLHVDPAVASGPLITTVNDLVAVIAYYGTASILLIQILQLY